MVNTQCAQRRCVFKHHVKISQRSTETNWSYMPAKF